MDRVARHPPARGENRFVPVGTLDLTRDSTGRTKGHRPPAVPRRGRWLFPFSKDCTAFSTREQSFARENRLLPAQPDRHTGRSANASLNTGYSNRNDAGKGRNTGERDGATYSAGHTGDASGHDDNDSGADGGTSNSGERRGNAPRREGSSGQRSRTPASPRPVPRGFNR